MRKTFFTALLIVLFFACSSPAAKYANDPTRLTVGARVLGLGNSFAAIADDPSAIFLNPAGLGIIDNWQVASMSGRFINIYDYVELAGVVPTPWGSFGLGYGGSALEFRYPSSEVVVVGGETRIIATGEVSGKYANTALVLAYGKQFDLWQFNDLALGASLKILTQDLQAGTAINGSASGLELDLGGLYPVNDNLSIALALNNALPAALGGKLHWTTDTDETFPARLKAGLAYDLYKDDPYVDKPNRWLTLAADYDQQVNRPEVPGLLHAGVEWLPHPLLALRAGIDASDLAYGLGLFWDDWRFDYAYHTYNDLADNATNYFSFSYAGFPLEERPSGPDYVRLISPVNDAVVPDDKILLQGRVTDRSVTSLQINGSLVSIGPHGSFMSEYPLEMGDNIFLIIAYGDQQQVLRSIDLQVIRLVSFADVPDDYWAKLPIEQLAALNVISGYPDHTFRPDQLISRAELVALIMRLVGIVEEGGPGPAFADVPDDHWAGFYISEAVKQGLVTGYSGELFKPAQPVTRAEGIAILTRFAQLPEFETALPPFNDVPADHWAAGLITSAREAGYLDYLGHELRPDQDMRRGEVAFILSRTPVVKQKIAVLMGEVEQ